MPVKDTQEKELGFLSRTRGRKEREDYALEFKIYYIGLEFTVMQNVLEYNRMSLSCLFLMKAEE